MDIQAWIQILINGGLLDERQCRQLCEKVYFFVNFKSRQKKF